MPEVAEAAPGAAGTTVGALEAGDAGVDAGAEAAQLARDPSAFDPVRHQSALFVEDGY